MLLIFLYILLGIGACYWLVQLIRVGVPAALSLFLIIPFFVLRLLQSFWKQRIWTLPLWGIPAFILIICMMVAPSDQFGMMWGILAFLTLIVSALAMAWCYRDGRPLKDLP